MPLKVLVTRDPDDAHVTAERLRQAGFEVALAPLIRRRADDASLARAVLTTPTPDVLLLTSAFVARQLGRVGISGLAPRCVACVGRATADAARAAGLVVDLVPAEASGTALVEALGVLSGLTVLYPRADEALASTREALARAGARIVDVVAYTTSPAPGGAAALNAAGPVDVVLLASPSTVRAYMAARAAATNHGSPSIVPIGRTTAEACRVAQLPLAEAGTIAAILATLRA